MSNSLDPDQARHFVGPDMGPNYLQRLSTVDTSRQRADVCFRNLTRMRVIPISYDVSQHDIFSMRCAFWEVQFLKMSKKPNFPENCYHFIQVKPICFLSKQNNFDLYVFSYKLFVRSVDNNSGHPSRVCYMCSEPNMETCNSA